MTTSSVRPGTRYTYLALDLLLLAGIPAGLLAAINGVRDHSLAELLAGAATTAIGAVGAWLAERPGLARLAGPAGTPTAVLATCISNLLDRFRGETMSAADQDVWAQARSLRDVGDRVAMWLTGELKSQPGYCGPCDVDERDAPGITAALVLLNRSGFVTNSSQAGADEVTDGGRHWQQYAAVCGFAAPDTAAMLLDALHDVPGITVIECVEHGRLDWTEVDPVTFVDGCAVTDFGRALPGSEIADDWTGYGVCHPDAVDALINARQLVIRDTEFGRNDRLWPLLIAVAAQHQPRR